MTSSLPLRCLAIAATLLLLAAFPTHAAAAGTPAGAADDPKAEKTVAPYGDLSDQRFWLSLGAFLPSFESNVRLDSEDALVPGTSINTEDILGLDDDNTNYRFDFVWHIAPRHALAARYFQFNRTATAQIDADIQYGDVLFAADTIIETEADLSYYGLSYRYSFTQKDGVDVFLIAGFDTFDVSASLAGSGTITGGGGTLGAFDGEVSEGIVAPVPVLGFGLSIELTHRLFLREELEFFGLKVAGIKGSLTDNRISLDWHPFKHVGFGLGYNHIRLKVEETDGEATDVDVDYELKGGRLYVTVTF